MATTSTFKVLLETLADRSDIGWVLGTVTGATTGWTSSTSQTKAPVSSQRWPRGSPIIATAGGAVGETSYIDTYVASTGAGTVEPDFSTTWTDGIIWDYGSIVHADQVKDCINRALSLNCCRWQKQPLTFVPDGDYLGTIASYWTASAGTGSYVDQAYPETVSRAAQISHSSTATLTSNTIPARAGDTWYVETAIRATTDSDTAAISVVDIAGSTPITPTFQVGDGSTTSRAFQMQRFVFTVPGTQDTDARIAFRLTVSGSGTMTAQMAPIIAYPQKAMSFPLQQRVVRADRIGNFVYGYGGGSPAGPDERTYSTPITIGGRTATLSQDADHFTVTFNFQLSGPVYYDELVYGSELSAMTDTTTFEKEYVVKWALVYLYELLSRKDPKEYAVRMSSAQKSVRMLEDAIVPHVTVVGRR